MAPNVSDDTEKIENEIISLVSLGDWKTLLRIGSPNKLFPWLWPNEQNLQFIARTVTSFDINKIASIGCGSGLLEWLIQQATGLSVKGIEVDRCWWRSKYSQQTFIRMEYAEEFPMGYEAVSEDEAILFCYFNNEPAFLSYMEHYRGPCLIVIGPGKLRGTHTAPDPLHLPDKIKSTWKLSELQEVYSGKDFIAIFRRF